MHPLRFTAMGFVVKLFVVVLLSLSYWITCLESSHYGSIRIPLTSAFLGDVNLTVGDVCRLIDDEDCIQSEYSYLQAGTCITQYNSSTMAALGLCHYSPEKISWLERPFSNYYSLLSDLPFVEQSSLTCGPYNREGLLCSECKPGYGPAVYSFSLMCAECSDNGVGWALYLFVVLFPITVFYIIVIIFNIRATAPPFTTFVLMCQVYCTLDLIYIPLSLRLKGVNLFH